MGATFTIDEILTATGGTLVHQGAWDTFCGVSTDSRTSQTGELFIPLTGERHDGHEFIPAALRRGARGVLGAAVVGQAVAVARHLDRLVPDERAAGLDGRRPAGRRDLGVGALAGRAGGGGASGHDILTWFK